MTTTYHSFGIMMGIISFILWGLVPIYWKEISHIDSYELLTHRVFWGALTLSAVHFIRYKKRSIETLRYFLRPSKRRKILLLTSFIIFSNWFVFVWAVNNSHVLETSIGYFINPLINVFFGVVILNESLSKYKKMALVISSVGVSFLLFRGVGSIWISLFLAGGFSLYGLLRKIGDIPSSLGLLIELLFCLIPSFCIFVFKSYNGSFLFFSQPLLTKLYLMLAGPVTIAPLLCFNYALKRIELSTIGIIQFISPSLHFLLAVYLYGEVFSDTYKVALSLIWISLVIYIYDTFRASKYFKSGSIGAV